MKARTTIKFIKNHFNCIAIGYCDLQNLLADRRAIYYTCGIYGWNFDAYYYSDYMICTGYRNMPGIHVSYEEVRKYDNLARKSLMKYGYCERGARIRDFLLDRFVKSVTK